MQEQQFIIIARGGSYAAPYTSHVILNGEDPDWLEWAEEEGDNDSSFDEWCNCVLNDLADDLEQHGASVVVLSLEEYRNLPKF